VTPARPAELSPLKRVGHKGADLIAPGNTFDSFQAALEAGVDMIEFDVLRVRDGRLVLAHDFDDASRREPVSLSAARVWASERSACSACSR